MVSEDEVKKIARLSRLEIKPEFIPVATGHMNSILDYVACLNEVDTSRVEAMSHVSDATNVLRKDVTLSPGSSPLPQPLSNEPIPQQSMLPSDALTQNAPDVNGTFIKVPLIVE
jgi:aspartyl-tRNA(Asn)/glutamyl-tRNA(Gln) amidotransferase subunit C